jgi:hypothetical protein
MRKRIRTVTRRTVLRGMGVTMCLPWLESLPSFARPASTSSAEALPQRFAVLFMGNGVNGNHWWARGNGDTMKLSKTLSPLEPIKKKINVINGLFNQMSVGIGIHPGQTGSLLSGASILKGPVVRAGVTMDQALAKHLGQETPQSSIVLACEQPMTGYHETNFSMAYSSHLSWQSPDSPVPNEVYPSLAFDNLFENRGSLRYSSILDRVKDRAEKLSRKVSSTDKLKLDEYLTSVREVERRVERMRLLKDKAEDQAKLKNRPLLTMERPRNGLPEDLRDHARLMVDIIALAFQSDKTRIASLLLARDLSSLYYPFLDVREGHHGASHDDLSDGYERISRFHLSQFASLAQKLDSMPEGEGTVLDNCCLLYLSNLWAGWKHDNMKLPVVTAGGLGGTLETGRSLDYLRAGDENRKLCSLYLGIMDRMGLKLDSFGDATTRLKGL